MNSRMPWMMVMIRPPLRRWSRSVLLAGLLLPSGLADVARAQRDLKDIPPPDPELERASFEVADGFEVNLYAADPLLAKPIQMNFDPDGRLWVASSEIYPHIKPGEKANDKIIVLEDNDADGQAETTRVFADGLLIPTGVEPGDGGAYVANSTELVHLADRDGDGRADHRQVLLSGFGTEDTHHILHTLRWGPDGLLYFNQSIYIHSHIETPQGVRRLGGGGIWHFRPETRQLEVYARGFVNPWGHHFDPWGQSLATDGAYGEGVNYVFPGATFFSAPGAVRILKGLNPGSPKHCGLEIVSGRHLPDDWQGNVITNDFRAHRVCRFVISEDGSGYASSEQPEVIKTAHVAFRPIDVKMGPDGAIYIADWYNPIIQHGEVDFRDERRDHVHGRIWRVTAKGRPLVERARLSDASTAVLLDALKSPEDWTRQRAKRVLKERGPSFLADLAAWVLALDDHDPLVEHHRLEALWTYQSLDVVEPALLESLLRAQDHRVRAGATRVVYHWHARLADPMRLLTVQVADDHPRVRLEAIRALAQLGTADAVRTALRALDRPMDGNLDFALWLTCRELLNIWLRALEAGKFEVSRVAHLEFALRAADSPSIVAPLIQLLQTGQIPVEREEATMSLIAALGSPAEMGMVFSQAVIDPNATSTRKGRILSALVESSRQRQVRPEGDLTQLAGLLSDGDQALVATALRAAGVWQVDALQARLVALAESAQPSLDLRTAAMEGLASYANPTSRESLLRLANERETIQIRTLAIVALAALDLPVAAAQAAQLLSEDRKDVDPAPLVEAFLARKTGPAVLGTYLAEKRLSADMAKLAIRAARSSARTDETLIEALRKSGSLESTPAPLSPEQVQELVTEVRQRGNAARGEKIFRRQEASCLKCHAIGGSGGQVGPDLASIGASAQVDYLIDSILQPNKAVKENYHSLVVATDDGEIATGIKVRETDKDLLLRTADDRELAIRLTSIAEQAPGQSLMPVGLADGLTRSELIDLVRFLSELGKVGPYALGNARVVRRWQVFVGPGEPSPANSVEPASLSDEGAISPWRSVYSLVSGGIRLGDLGTNAGTRRAWARFQLEVTTPGAVALAISPIKGIDAWLDGVDLKVDNAGPQQPLQLELSAGTRTVTLSVPLDDPSAMLRVELVELPGSRAHAQLVGGK